MFEQKLLIVGFRTKLHSFVYQNWFVAHLPGIWRNKALGQLDSFYVLLKDYDDAFNQYN